MVGTLNFFDISTVQYFGCKLCMGARFTSAINLIYFKGCILGAIQNASTKISDSISALGPCEFIKHIWL